MSEKNSISCGSGKIVDIHIAPEADADMQSLTEVEAVEGQGLEGDRYFKRAGTWSGEQGRDLPHEDRALTLFESEMSQIIKRDAGIDLKPGEHRRNITTEGVSASHLLDERFHIGNAICEGVELCEPCFNLEKRTGEEGLLSSLVHRGGLNARIIESGTIHVGDSITLI